MNSMSPRTRYLAEISGLDIETLPTWARALNWMDKFYEPGNERHPPFTGCFDFWTVGNIGPNAGKSDRFAPLPPFVVKYIDGRILFESKGSPKERLYFLLYFPMRWDQMEESMWALPDER